MTEARDDRRVDADSRPRRSEDAHWRELDDHVVILDLDSSVYSTLNPVGSLIWNEIDGTLTVGQIVEVVVEVFDVSRDRALDDTLEFLGAMVDEGLVDV